MNLMFWNCNNLTSLDLSSFNTENVKSMKSTFSRSNSLTSLNLSNFNTEKVHNMNDNFFWMFFITISRFI